MAMLIVSQCSTNKTGPNFQHYGKLFICNLRAACCNSGQGHLCCNSLCSFSPLLLQYNKKKNHFVISAIEIHGDNIKAYYRQVQAMKAQNRIAEALKIAQKGHLKQPNVRYKYAFCSSILQKDIINVGLKFWLFFCLFVFVFVVKNRHSVTIFACY